MLYGVYVLMQVVVVYGANPAGACIVAQQVYTSLPKAMPKSGLNSLQQYAEATGMSVMRVWVPKCNTFTTRIEGMPAKAS